MAVAALILLPLIASAQFRFPGEEASSPDVLVSPDPLPTQLIASQITLRVIQILLAIAGLIAVLFLIIGGLRYITAHGNEEQAEAAKKTITHAIIGVVIVILAFVIIRVIANALIKKDI